jgi:hypothetical protein
MRRNAAPEQAIRHAILEAYGARPDAFIYRVEPVPSPFTRQPSAPPGHSDLVLHLGGRSYWIETKSPVGRQSPSQLIFQAALKRAGVDRYIIARSVQDVDAALTD